MVTIDPHNVSVQDWVNIYNAGGWCRCGSGPGSRLRVNGKLIEFLKKAIGDQQIGSIIDVGCGDLQWMSGIITNIESYTGIDCVPAIIEQNKTKFPQHTFLTLDITSQDIPCTTFDMLICKDLFHHLINHHELLLQKIESVKARYKVIVIPEAQAIVETFRNLLEVSGWVKVMVYRADEFKAIYCKIA